MPNGSKGEMMSRRDLITEANRSGSLSVVMGKHSSCQPRAWQLSSPPVQRMPSHYTKHDVELLLKALWIMFTEKQASKLIVPVPWDTTEEPQRMRIADLAILLESWLS